MRGKIALFALDTLVNMLAAAGLQVEMHVGKAARGPEKEQAA
jgi:predicted XRE-type DNA-binding protein